jgi:23S rRNA (adenine2503-C2)-methyltransferase
MSIYDLEPDALAALLADEPAWRIEQLRHGLYREGRPLEDVSTLPRTLRARLRAAVGPDLELAAKQVADEGRTVKLALRAPDGALIETVLMRYDDRTSVCVSSQAGCAMGCRFCATGQAGFIRHLRAGEILEQVAWAQRVQVTGRISHVVFMGMGEPLANAGAVVEAIGRLRSDVGISPRRITVSTVGIVPGIHRLRTTRLPVTLAISLHAANDALRSELVPMNRRYPIEAVLEAGANWSRATGRRLTLEWALIAGVNDRHRDAVELAARARSLGAHVNLIPLNPTPGYPMVGTDEAGVRRFARQLRELGVNVTVRDTRGRDIDAACGQLATSLVVAQGIDEHEGLGRRGARLVSPVGSLKLGEGPSAQVG